MTKLLRILLVFSLIVTSTGWAQANSPAPAVKDYVVLFQQDKLPVDYEQIITSAGGSVTAAIPQIGAVLARADKQDFLTGLAGNGQVTEAGVNVEISLEEGIKHSFATSSLAAPQPGDLYQMFQWDIQRVGGIPATWAVQSGNHKVVVAVVDTGIDAKHPDLAANYLFGKSFVPGFPEAGEDGNGHGTHVAGTIAADGRVKGVGPGLGLASYRVFDPAGRGQVGTVAQAIVTAADDGAKVINLSLEGYAAKKYKESMAEYLVMKRAVDYANKQGAVVVAAAGNQGFDLKQKTQLVPTLRGPVVVIPAGVPGAVGVSATNKADQRAFYSNYGKQVIDLTAPGGDLGPNFDPATMTGEIDFLSMNFSTAPGGGYRWLLGTSMATPKVSAVAGLIIAQQGNNIKPDRVAHILRKSAQDIGEPGRDSYFGYGMVDAQAAIKAE